VALGDITHRWIGGVVDDDDGELSVEGGRHESRRPGAPKATIRTSTSGLAAGEPRSSGAEALSAGPTSAPAPDVGGWPRGSLLVGVGLVRVIDRVTDPVEGHAEHPALCGLEPVDGPFEVVPVGPTFRRDHHRPVRHPGEDSRVRHGQDRWRVEDDDVGQEGELVEDGLDAGAPNSSLGLSSCVPAGSTWSPQIPVSTSSDFTEDSSASSPTSRLVREGVARSAGTVGRSSGDASRLTGSRAATGGCPGPGSSNSIG